MDSGEVVIDRMDGDHRRVVLNFLAETLVSLVKRLIPIRIVRLAHSM
jgi:hypothetical protein